MANSTNGSVLSFGTAVMNIVSVSFSVGGQDIDVTDLADSSHLYETGIDDIECTAEVIGEASDISRGEVGSIEITWNSGGTDSIGTAVCTSKEKGGSLDDKVTTSLTFKPTPS